MRPKQIGEFGFINKISRGCLIQPDNIVRAIGDDTPGGATIRPPRFAYLRTLVKRRDINTSSIQWCS